MGRGNNHPAFSYAVLVSLAGGSGYVLKRHLPSLVGGTALGVGFLGAGLLVLTDTISDHTFGHGTSVVMSGIITAVMGRHAWMTRLRVPAALAGGGALSTGYHIQRIADPPRRMKYVPGAPPVPPSAASV
ncbi:hypothetical protein Poli38472_006306 [Pythium oligandrum]|uniref:Transmembrane protein 14C n=1 Tax=Pythium oligandrum TaxID=41045 RepID=A0A8K1CTV2_PYTOL|nr:hypothetical protein Poli38472_006306 [Pythium oligandrum]|eukprot:TMW68838.1 hypothetical protein Poli38472_006306 [Pythium oligandrum]